MNRRTVDVKVPEAQDKGEAADTPVCERASPSPSDFESFRSALEAGWVGLWSWDLRSHQMVWSTNLETFHGRQENTFEGTLSIAPEDFAPQDATGVLAAIGKTLQTHEPCRLEYRLPGRSEREERWFEASVTVIVQDGVAVQLLGLCRDVTERLRVNREVRVRARQQETLARLGERALTEGDLQKFFNDVVTTVGEILDVEMVKILELVPGDAELPDPLELRQESAGLDDRVRRGPFNPLADVALDHGTWGVRDQHLLDFERRNVLAAADDDVLLPVDDQHVAIPVDRRQVSGMEPSALHGGEAVVGPFPVTLHDDVAARDDLANRLAIMGHVAAIGIDDADFDAGNCVACAGALVMTDLIVTGHALLD